MKNKIIQDHDEGLVTVAQGSLCEKQIMFEWTEEWPKSYKFS